MLVDLVALHPGPEQLVVIVAEQVAKEWLRVL